MMTSFLLLLLSLPAFAQKGEPSFEVSVDPGTYPVSAFRAKDVRAKELPRRSGKSTIASKSVREEAFAKVKGLSKEIQHLDEADRDVLYLRARSKTLKDLTKSYPKIPKAMLSQLRSQARSR